MGKRIILYCSLLLIFAAKLTAASVVDASHEDENITLIKSAIEKSGAKWSIGESWVSKLSVDERRKLCGTIVDRTVLDTSKYTPIETRHDLPARFDWRHHQGGNWITPVKDQGMCGSCWDFAAIGQIEAWWRIHNSRLDSVIDLSEQFVLSCSPGSCDGYTVEGAFEFIKEVGVPLETCMYYNGIDAYPCSRACADWEEQALKIQGWGYITLDFDDIDNIKTAILRQPVAGSFLVYEDFMYYGNGVYEHVWGGIEAGHAVLIVGWDDKDECWICKNSWGPSWGEQGYFRIKWGECGMGEYIPFIWNNAASLSGMYLSPMNLDVQLTIGDTVVNTIEIFNFSDDVLHFSAICSQVELMFHPDEFTAFEGKSWWCGDPEIMGYGDHWLQYLETPMIDLSNTADPMLTWKGKWNIESPAGASYPYDGWDGCNVWISVDGGSSFDVLYPLNPPYNCSSMWSFGHPEEGWNMGNNIAGWGGESDGWTTIDMDLASYKSDSVVIRFAFASDMGLSTPDDPNLIGFFVDDVLIKDGLDLIFQNTSDNLGTMKRLAFSPNDVSNWFYLSESIGSVPPQSSKKIDVHIETADLSAGSHSGVIVFLSNDIGNGPLSFPITLDLEKPEHDIVIENISLPAENIVLLSNVNLSADIRNGGKHDESYFDVVFSVLDNNTAIFSDTLHIDHIQVDQSLNLKFDPFSIRQEGEHRFEIKVINFADDYNSGNNDINTNVNVVDLIDDFERDIDQWLITDGWGITGEFSGYKSNRCLHVNGGITPYSNNMDVICLYSPGLSVKAADNLELVFHARYNTETNVDKCYIEISPDRSEWVKVDSLTGVHPVWLQRAISLSADAISEWENLWFRFRFISDSQNSAFGVLIDDVRINLKTTTDLAEFPQGDADTPEGFKLSQNYPNPFNMSTRIEFLIPEAGHVTISVYNLQGQQVAQIYDAYRQAGENVVSWDGNNGNGMHIGSGIYFYRIEVDKKFTRTNKMVIIK